MENSETADVQTELSPLIEYYIYSSAYVGHFQPILQAKIGMENIRISPQNENKK